VVVCLEQGADLHMTQLMPLPLTVSCFSKIRIGFTFLVPAHLGSPGKRAIKWGVCVTICLSGTVSEILALISQNFKRLRTLNAPPSCRTSTCVMPILFAFNLQTKFQMSGFIHSKDMAWAPKCRNGPNDLDYARLRDSQASQD